MRSHYVYRAERSVETASSSRTSAGHGGSRGDHSILTTGTCDTSSATTARARRQSAGA